ncbi:MAG: GHKL domain-containing protein [Defluviitaleaceae bacterium]|nr:GHKL domain-containing protein [Defluviitaleaceae bacterium]
MPFIFWFWNVVACVLIVFAQERFMWVFYEERKTSFRVYALSFLAAVGLMIAIMIAHVLAFGEEKILGILRVVNFAAPAFIISLNYKSLWIKRFAVAASSFLVLTLTSTLAPLPFLALYLFFGIDLIIWTDTLAILLPVVVVLLLRYFKNIRKDLINSPKIWMPAIIVPSLYVSLEILRLFLAEQSALAYLISWFHTTLILLGVILLILLLYNNISAAFEDKLKSSLQAQEKDYYFSQVQLMQQSAEQIKAIRHDMRLHLCAIAAHTAENPAATEYITKLLGEIDNSEIHSETGNIAVDSIINFKLNNTKIENLQPKIRLLVPTTIAIETADIITILGNLLDNALDALEKATDKALNLEIELSKGTLFIKVENAFDGELKFGKNGRLTSQKQGSEHGYGLKNVRRTVEKYNGCMDITHENGVFSVTVMLYV